MTKKPSPFPVVPRMKTRHDIDPELLQIEHNTPLPSFRNRESDKYFPLFSKLKPGSCLVCLPAETPRVAQALRKVLEQGKYPAIKGCKVLSRAHCEDGHGRVWAMPPAKAK